MRNSKWKGKGGELVIELYEKEGENTFFGRKVFYRGNG